MLQAFAQLLSALGKLFFGILGKADIQGAQAVPITPPPTPPAPIEPPPPVPVPVPAPPARGSIPAPVGQVNVLTGHYVIPSGHGPQSSWWDGAFTVTQHYGCTDYAPEGHNPFHPECQYFHEGDDFGLPCGTPIYAGSYVTVVSIDPPGYGPVGDSAAIQLRLSNYDVWIYHMSSYVVKVGQKLVPGALIGYSGKRGYATGCHVHFEVRPANAPYRHSINPLPLIFFPSH